MQIIELTKEFKVGAKVVNAVEVVPVGFMRMSELLTDAGRKATPTMPVEVMYRSLRMIEHCTYVFEDGTRDKPTIITLGGLPFRTTKAITTLIDGPALDGEPGSVVDGSGDGIDTPILYKLGTPFKMIGSDGEQVVSELEFLIENYTSAEMILAAQGTFNQAIALLQYNAKPVGSSLQTVPSKAMEQITYSDGKFIADTIIPQLFN